MISDVGKVKELLAINERLNQIKDIDSLLDYILYESRKYTNADAGSIFLIKNNVLEFSYIQNDTLIKHKPNNKLTYSYFTIPIDNSSICGHVVLSGKALMIEDVYHLPPGVPYSFNSHFDVVSKYRTQSMLAIPLITSTGAVLGVMQIINSLDEKGRVIQFHEDDRLYVSYFANNATVIIDKAKMTRDMVLRMVKMAQFSDPKETGTHVNRVGAYSIEIYHCWALKKGLPKEEIKHKKDILRIAAMLHDVGKIAIPDTILKKPARLTVAEFEKIKQHTEYGAGLFSDPLSDIEELSALITMTHHEKWDGSGYPNKLRGAEIPLEGRVVALADVYDALASKRVYKEAWDELRVLNYIQEQSGEHFDPELVEAFMEIYEVIQAIRERYPETE